MGASLLPYPNPKQGVEQWLEPLLSASTTAHRPGATKNTSSLRASVAEALRENLDRDQSTSSSLSGTSRVSPTYLHKGKRRLTSKGQCKPVQAFQREAGEGWFELANDCDSPLGESLGHAMLACPEGGTARSRTACMYS